MNPFYISDDLKVDLQLLSLKMTWQKLVLSVLRAKLTKLILQLTFLQGKVFSSDCDKLLNYLSGKEWSDVLKAVRCLHEQ